MEETIIYNLARYKMRQPNLPIQNNNSVLLLNLNSFQLLEIQVQQWLFWFMSGLPYQKKTRLSFKNA